MTAVTAPTPVRRPRAALLLAALAGGALLLGPARPAAAAPAAQTAPAAKDDCKDDGWRRFTALGFKNQGECVSSVAHLGGGGLPDLDPAATPELGSLALFAGGAAGLGGYALAQARRRLPRAPARPRAALGPHQGRRGTLP